jgi:hypothetical protein
MDAKWLLDQRSHAEMAEHLSGLLHGLAEEMAGREKELGVASDVVTKIRKLAKDISVASNAYTRGIDAKIGALR